MAVTFVPQPEEKGENSVNTECNTMSRASLMNFSKGHHQLTSTNDFSTRNLSSFDTAAGNSVQPGRSRISMHQNNKEKKTFGLKRFYRNLQDFLGDVLCTSIHSYMILISCVITAIVQYVMPKHWHEVLEARAASNTLTILGSFLGFALVFRTQTC